MDPDLIKKFKTILNALCTTHYINPDKFQEFASDTAELYKTMYGAWRTMSPTVHKVLAHGGNVMKYHILPLGELSEEAQEAANKNYKKYRLHNARKNSRVNQNKDLFFMLLTSSDPLISSLRTKSKSYKYDSDPDLLPLLD